MKKTTRLLSILFSILCVKCVRSETYNISTPEELIELSNLVNGGKSFNGTTVFLTNDIDFDAALSKKFKPIGVYTSDSNNKPFSGEFNGQGYLIRSLAINSNAIDVGLIGYTRGSTIKNVVMDSTCSSTGTYTGSYYSYVAGIVGRCYSYDYNCTFEGNVNMASVLFSGSISGKTALIGGVAGELRPINHPNYIINCINRGSISFTGTTGLNTYLGGVFGKIYTSGGAIGTFINNLNYGTITAKGSTDSTLYLGGITSYLESGSNTLSNSANFGKIDYSKAKYSSLYVGSIISDINNNVVENCYWSDEMAKGYAAIDSSGKATGILSFDKDFILSDGRSLVEVLNNNSGGYPKWNTIEFHCNGGRLPNYPNSDVVKIVEMTTTLSCPKKTNEKFLGWCTDASLETLAGAELPEPATLYAKYGWTITFDLNGESEYGPLVLKYNEPFTPPTYYKEGFTFSWFLKKEPKKINSTSYYTPNFDVTFKAQWTPKKYELKFVFNNTEEDRVNEVDCNSTIIYPDDPEREGYTFNGWDKSDIEFMPAENLTITALWTINQYELRFDFNNSEEDIAEDVDYNSAITYPNDPEREGYTFAGWDKNDTEFMPAENLTITALWTVNKYTIKFDLNGGDAVSQETMEVTYDNVYGPLPIPDRVDYGFIGWFTHETEDSEKIEADTLVNITSNQTLYAHWEVATITLMLNATGGSPSLSTKKIRCGSAYGTLQVPEKTGYKFMGWYTDVAEGVKIESITEVTVTSSQTLYAHWSANSYLVTYDVNGGDALAQPTKEVTYGSKYGTLPAPQRAGYAFDGWYLNAGDADKITSNTIVSIPNDHTIYAKWTANMCELRFVLNNGEEDSVEIIPCDSEIVYPENPKKEGYSFDGWDSNFKKMPAHNLTITAFWTIASYKLTFDYNNGTVIEKTVTYGEAINYPECTVMEEGASFYDWEPKPKTMPGNDLVTKAQWMKVTRFAEVIFGTTEKTKTELVDLLGKYTNSQFSVDRFEQATSEGATRLIIEFDRFETAREFVAKVKDTIKDDPKNLIKDASLFYGKQMSYSFGLYPAFVLSLFLLF